jgi:hypothetical protein
MVMIWVSILCVTVDPSFMSLDVFLWNARPTNIYQKQQFGYDTIRLRCVALRCVAHWYGRADL